MNHTCEYPPGCDAPAMPGHRACQPHYILVSALLGSPDTPAPSSDEIEWANRHLAAQNSVTAEPVILTLDRQPTGSSQAVWDENGPHVIWTGEMAQPCIWYPSGCGEADGQNSWAAWVPYTLPEHFDATPPTDADDWRDIFENANVLGAWGETYWESAEHAERFIRHEPRHG